MAKLDIEGLARVAFNVDCHGLTQAEHDEAWRLESINDRVSPYFEIARALLIALRSPSEEMIETGAATLDRLSTEDGTFHRDATLVFQDMIDTLLNSRGM